MTDEHADEPRQRRAARIRYALLRVGFVLLLCTTVVLLIWKWVSEDEREEVFYSRQLETMTLSEAVTASETQAALVALGDAVGAVVRRYMNQGNLGGIRGYFRAVAVSPRIMTMTLMRNDGKVLISTDRKREGISMSNMFRNTTSRLPGVYVDATNEENYLVLVPIEGEKTRLGLVIISYQRIAFQDLLSIERSRN